MGPYKPPALAFQQSHEERTLAHSAIISTANKLEKFCSPSPVTAQGGSLGMYQSMSPPSGEPLWRFLLLRLWPPFRLGIGYHPWTSSYATPAFFRALGSLPVPTSCCPRTPQADLAVLVLPLQYVNKCRPHSRRTLLSLQPYNLARSGICLVMNGHKNCCRAFKEGRLIRSLLAHRLT